MLAFIILLLFSMTHYTNWRDEEIVRWERDVNNIKSYRSNGKTIYYTSCYFEGSLCNDPRIAASEKELLILKYCEYVLKMAEYFEKG